MTVEAFTDEQVDKARHALGLTRERIAYRNYYSTSSDDPEWEDLVARGFATKRKSPVSPDFLYHLTKQAAFFFLNEGERLDPELRFAAEPAPGPL
jgi:hypothetical protein